MEEYDAVIIGAGASGAIIALQLARAGKRVLILEAGRGVRSDEEGWMAAVNRFQTATAKVPNAAWPPTSTAPQLDVLQLNVIKDGVPDTSGYWVQKGPQTFGSDYARSKGGTTLHWQATTLRMLPNDFKMQTNYGVGCNWPISYEDLKPCYEKAENELGVAGDVGEQRLPGVDPKKFWGSYTFPMKKIPDHFMAKTFAKRLGDFSVKVEGKDYPLYVTPTPQARNGMPNPDYVDPTTGAKGYKPTGTQSDPLRGERCQGNSSCVIVCPTQAKYSAHRTLNRATDITTVSGPRVEIRNQSVVSKIVTNKTTGRVEHVEYFACDQGGGPSVPKTAKGKTYIVAAHSVESAKLLLVSDIANSSDELGRNLMDHPTMLTWGLMEEPVWPFRGPGSTNALPTFRDGPFRRDMSAFVVPIDNWGWVWSKIAPDVPFADLISKGMFGKQLRQHVAHDFSRQITLQWEFEQLGQRENRVTIDRQFLDPLGIPRPVVSYTVNDYVRKAMATAFDISAKLFKKVGIKDCTQYSKDNLGYVEYQGKGYEFQGCGHLVGTHRMGFTRHDSVTDSWMRCWDHENLYVVGCGSMPTFGTSNPTLTMSALAFRASESIIRDLNKEGPINL